MVSPSSRTTVFFVSVALRGEWKRSWQASDCTADLFQLNCLRFIHMEHLQFFGFCINLLEYHSQVPQNGGLTKIHFLTTLEARTLRSKCPQGSFHLEVSLPWECRWPPSLCSWSSSTCAYVLITSS